MIIIKSLLLSFVILSSINNCYARWGTVHDAPIEIITFNRKIHVNKDGTSKELIEARIKILNQIGRTRYSNYRMHYNHDNSKVKILEAKTIVNNKEYKVTPDSIEDKSLASVPDGFDDIHQILIVFPHADIGAELNLKYEQILTHPPLDNFYETFFMYGTEGLTANSDGIIELSSEIPFYIHINDPKGILKVKQYSDNEQHYLNIKQNDPIFTQLFNEQNAKLDPKHVTEVHLSTIKSWKEYGKRLQPEYLRVLKQPLPDLYKKIAELASKEKTLISKINKVTSLLAEKIRYMGDWRTTKGKFIPRDLEKVSSTEYGDCKDLATATAVILNSLGIKADLALIKRGSWIYESLSHLAGFSKFNHIIVRVKNGKDFIWIDPTNVSSMAGEIFFDISNRKALVITTDIPEMASTPPLKPENFLIEIAQTIDLSNENIYKVNGELYYHKNAASYLTASELFASEENIKHYILNQLGETSRMIYKQVNMPSLKSRIVKDLNFSYTFSERSSEIITNSGQGIMLGNLGLDGYIADPTRMSDLFLGEPNTLKFHKIYKNIKSSQQKLKNISITSKWLDVHRKINYGKDYIKVSDILIIKKSLITNKELRSKEYLDMHKRLEKYFANGTAIIFDRIT